MAGFDYDVVIIGSGFGGSVAALRSAEKGYRVGHQGRLTGLSSELGKRGRTTRYRTTVPDDRSGQRDPERVRRAVLP
jgi:choline dehydrogenase-like flavoprotein